MRLLEGTDLRARMAQGAGAAALTASLNLATAERGTVGTHPLLFIAAVLTTSIVAGVAGGVVYFYTEPLRAKGGWRRTLGNVVTLLLFCAAAVGILSLAALTV
jgi:hypothetical protein